MAFPSRAGSRSATLHRSRAGGHDSGNAHRPVSRPLTAFVLRPILGSIQCAYEARRTTAHHQIGSEDGFVKMNRRLLLKSAAGLWLAGGMDDALAQATRSSGKEKWEPLFNGRNLDGWYTFLSQSGRTADHRNFVRVHDRMIHVLDQEPTEASPQSGYFCTEKEYSHYHLRVEYKWGERRFPPRSIWKRDNGILYHITAPDRVWPLCMEFQIQETDVGDTIGVGARFVPGAGEGLGPPGLATWPNPPARLADPNFQPPKVSRLPRTGDFENRDGWNVLELIVMGDKSAHLVNGRLVASAFNIERRSPDDREKYVPLNTGRIGLEVEYAETFFRRIDIRPLPGA